MAQVIGLWSAVVKAGEPVIVDAPAAIRVLNVSLGEEVADENGRSVVKLTYEALKVVEDDEDDAGTATTTTVLCSLTAGKTESTTVDLVLEGESAYQFEVSGKNTVYLSGNYIDQGDDQDPSDDEMGFDSDSEAAGYDLRDVSSDVETHPDDLESDASRFEEVVDQPAKTQKRPRDSEEAKAGPEPKGKKSKKQKSESGEAVTVEEAKPAVSEKKKDKKKETPAAEEAAKDAKATRTTPGGVIVKDVTVGHGPMAKKGNTVSMRYKGRLQNGKIFDQNVKGKPFTFHLGKGEVIKGWDEGIVGMQVEGQRMLTIPANMAYGKRGVEGIPPNSTLIFEVKLLEIK